MTTTEEGGGGGKAPPVEAHVVCGGAWHDFDHARLELLQELATDERARVTVSGDYRDVDRLAESSFLLTYTCNVRPSPSEQRALHDWVAGGGRWYALHATNAALDLVPGGVVAPRVIPLLAETLGSQFIAHPPIAPYRVEVTDPTHPLVAGISAFETTDELYLSEFHADVEVLLHTRFGGRAAGFAEADWSEPADRPVCYLRRLGAGTVLYLTLGHCRGHYDMRPDLDWWPTVDRGSWERPEFRTLLRRGIAWGLAGADDPRRNNDRTSEERP